MFDAIPNLHELFASLDHYLPFVLRLGGWAYLVFFAAAFFETGLILFSILPADSLIFSAGTFAALGSMNLGLLLLITFSATVLADSINYLLGRRAGRPLLHGRFPITSSERIIRTESFFASHGHVAVLIARFIPVVRALTPFVAGMALMPYRRFLLFNVAGGFVWVSVFLFAGYFFGNVAFVRENLVLILLVVTVVSTLPAMLGIFRQKARLDGQVIT